ncbi:CAAX protease [Chitinophaga parva]|uniref:CAAX protease n=1 Tax=Chitinophaga parva TaxID=2169414 RepID=A0A2T7BHL3_9BACT|nr:Abi family protein [Chitinophaga parva]PUZ25733.1 CAAX protease [Chitinophaga parva]
MQFKEFQRVISARRLSRYVAATRGNTRKAMTLYRLNLRLSHDFFSVISCFEVALRNAIDAHYSTVHGADWLRNAVKCGGIFDNHNCGKTPHIIREALQRLTGYDHCKLLSTLEFGFWRYCFAKHQYFVGGQSLLRIFPEKPKSTPAQRYDHNFVFRSLERLNELRNRIAHHEPVCFTPGTAQTSTAPIRADYALILQLFHWMQINQESFLYGVDRIQNICARIDHLHAGIK